MTSAIEILGLKREKLTLTDRRIRSGFAYKFFENATASTGIDRENLARALGMNIRSQARHKKENHLSESESDKLYRFARVVAIVMKKNREFGCCNEMANRTFF